MELTGSRDIAFDGHILGNNRRPRIEGFRFRLVEVFERFEDHFVFAKSFEGQSHDHLRRFVV